MLDTFRSVQRSSCHRFTALAAEQLSVQEVWSAADSSDRCLHRFLLTYDLFPGTQRLMELADDIEQIRTICWCGKRAHFNARLLNGEMVTEGEQVQLGGNESYISLCRRHYKQRKIEG
ncbi:hypothetical protein [Ruminococcus sp.]|uniref:hypothetical protein n=1 Tax=Ruminococcus sp. TaxID=41978 RepID=UPI0025F9024B|nr:hypothetical protein [Ruminococcus sp.]